VAAPPRSRKAGARDPGKQARGCPDHLAVARFAGSLSGAGRRFDLVPTRANGQPAFGAYLCPTTGIRHVTGLYVLTLAGPLPRSPAGPVLRYSP
jgi:hypothetical protein